MKTTAQWIAEFNELPATALKNAQWIDEAATFETVWYALETGVPEGKTFTECYGSPLRIHADREGWNDGIVLK